MKPAELNLKIALNNHKIASDRATFAQVARILAMSDATRAEANLALTLALADLMDAAMEVAYWRDVLAGRVDLG